MARPRRTFLGEDAETWRCILMVWFATFVLTVLYEETMLARRAEQELLAQQVTLRPAATTTERRGPALATERSVPRARWHLRPDGAHRRLGRGSRGSRRFRRRTR